MSEYYLSKKELYHHGVKGQKWGQRNYQNEDGSLTAAGREHYGYGKRVAKKVYSALSSDRAQKALRGFAKFTARVNNASTGGLDNEHKISKNAKPEVPATKFTKQKQAKDAVADYKKAVKKSDKSQSEADKAWEEAKNLRMQMGNTSVKRFIGAVKNNSEASKVYTKAFNKASALQDKADADWAEAKVKYSKTGKNRVSRILNNMRYNP